MRAPRQTKSVIIRQLQENLRRSRQHAETLEARLEGIEKRAGAEYARHFPNPISASDKLMRLGNSAYSLELFCQECRRPWPCPEWHAYRRVIGWDSTQYRIEWVEE